MVMGTSTAPARLLRVLGSLNEQMDECVSVLPCTAQAEQQLLLHEFNSTGREFPAEQCIHDLELIVDEELFDGLGSSVNGHCTYRIIKEGQDKYAKTTKNMDGTRSDGYLLAGN